MPRIYVADLAEYNAGNLVGQWIDLGEIIESNGGIEGAAEYVQDYIEQHILKPTHEEWAIHDYEGFGPIRIGEYDSLDHIVELAQGIEEHGEAFAEFVSYFGQTEGFEDAYIGEMSVKDYAYDLADEMLDCEGLSEESLSRRYFDYRQFALDLELGGDVVESNGYLFHGNW